MINHEMRLTSGTSGISVSTNTSFKTDEEAYEFMAAVNKLLVNDAQNKIENMRMQVLYHAGARGANVRSAIELIKSYRQIANTGLKEAKDWVEANMEDCIVRPSCNQYY